MATSIQLTFRGDDKVRRIRYDFNAISELEENLDAPIGMLLSEKEAGFRVLRGLLWVGLKWEHRSLTPQAVGDLIQQHLEEGGEIADLMKAATDALQRSGIFGKKEATEDPKKEAGEKQAPTSASTIG